MSFANRLVTVLTASFTNVYICRKSWNTKGEIAHGTIRLVGQFWVVFIFYFEFL